MALKEFACNESVGFDVRGKCSHFGVGDQRGFKKSGCEFFHSWTTDTGMDEQKILAGDSSLSVWEIKCDRVKVGPHTAKTDACVWAKGQQSNPGWEAVDHINRRNIQYPPFFP